MATTFNPNPISHQVLYLQKWLKPLPDISTSSPRFKPWAIENPTSINRFNGLLFAPHLLSQVLRTCDTLWAKGLSPYLLGPRITAIDRAQHIQITINLFLDLSFVKERKEAVTVVEALPIARNFSHTTCQRHSLLYSKLKRETNLFWFTFTKAVVCLRK